MPVATPSATQPARRVVRRAPRAFCGGARPGGGLCKRPPGWGTTHPGVGRCKRHDKRPEDNRRNAATMNGLHVGNELGVIMGTPLDVSPLEALLGCVRITAGEVAWMTQKIMQLTDGDAVGHPISRKMRPIKHEGGAEGYTMVTETNEGEVQLNIWIKERQKAVERLARYSKMALDAGVAERQVDIAKNFGNQLARMLRAVFDELELSPKQLARAPGVVRSQLQLLEGGLVSA